jgi:UDP-N-acetylglucosamine 2-epimerase
VETVQLGWNIVVGINSDFIADATHNLPIGEKRPMLYGNGDTAEKIVRKIVEKFPNNSKFGT